MLGSETTSAAPLIAFMLVVVLSILLALMFGANADGLDEVYVAGRSLGPWRNSLALTGDSVSVLTLLTTTGAISVAGYDGMTLAGSAVCALGILLVFARPLNETGRYTLGGTLSAKFPYRSVRIAAVVATLCFCVPMAMVQLMAAGGATAALVDLSSSGGVRLCTALIGMMMICASVFGGMRGNTILQLVKTVFLLAFIVVLTGLLMHEMNWDFGRLTDQAALRSEDPDGFYLPGGLAVTSAGSVDVLSSQLTVLVGSAIAPHVIMRVKTSATGGAAQRSVLRALAFFGLFTLVTVVLGLGAAALVSNPSSRYADPSGGTSLLRLVDHLGVESGGGLLQAAFVSVVFLTSMTVVTALTFSCGVTLAHDLYTHVRMRGDADPVTEFRVMRGVTPAVGLLMVFLAVVLQNWRVEFLAQFAVAVAAASILPALTYALFWSGATRLSVLWSVYGGLGCAVLLQVFGPTVSGAPSALFPEVDFSWFPLTTSGLVSIPVGFLCGWIGGRIGRQRTAAALRTPVRAKS
ncbi:cation acetate symporter [Streptomyces bobili]|uniref:sodium:solute symporter family transporter n=1 Tax=Streptomyces bobili TaxID=67280 RepID=UPI003661CE31